MKVLAPTLLTALAATAVLFAPTAAADSSTACDPTGGGTVCQSPGNVQIDDDPAPTQFFPYGGSAFLLGGGGPVGEGVPVGGMGVAASHAAGAHGGHR